VKRLTADDRDRMMKMRAVPDDFDNVGALHSPYGAVHGMATPISSPMDFTTPSYADHILRGPLMVDVRRTDGGDHMSPTGLSPAFGSIGFNASGGMNGAEILSPLSPVANDRHGYGSHLSPTSLGASARLGHPYQRHNSLDTSGSMQGHHGARKALQPLHLRESMSRSRSDSMQSPLRSSMSWKGDGINYGSYGQSSLSTSPTSRAGGQSRSGYPPGQIGGMASGIRYDSTSSSKPRL
jgi:hypothetical protein